MELGLRAGNIIYCLEANNAGEAQKDVHTFKVAGSSNAEKGFQIMKFKFQ